ncbi:MAG: hypothetical protein K1W02_01155 [Muribaculaceae bacterium]
MNRKLVNGLLLLSLTTVGCGTFTSCKDTDEDFKNEILADQANLRAELLKLIEENKCKCPEDLAARLTTIENWLKINDASSLDARVAAIIANTLSDYVTKEELKNFKDGEFAELGQTVAALNKALGDTKNELLEEINQCLEAIATNKTDISALQTLVAANKTQIDILTSRLNSLITSIELSQTYNPMFGTINLPIGLQTNIVANYYGVTDHNVAFPLKSTSIEVGSAEDVLKVANFGLTPKNGTLEISANDKYMDEGINNLGQLYLTINPNNVDFSGGNLTLINSNGVEAPISLDVKSNDELLSFGFNKGTRAEAPEKNGLYRADAHVNVEDAPSIAIEIEKGLKGAMKDALKNPSKQSLADLARILVDQMDGFLPAYGVKAAWTVTENGVDKEYAVYSKYEIAATAVHPLGYESLSDLNISHRLPTFSPLKEALENAFNELKNDLKFEFDKADFTIEGTTITIDLTGVVDPSALPAGSDGKIVLGYKDNGSVETTGNEDALNPLVGQIVEQVNKQLDSITGQINTQVSDMLDKIHDQLAGKLGSADKLLEKYNALANKINKFLENPNAYLQVSMAYEDSNGDLHMLSTDKNIPSVFTKSTGDAIQLFATSHTGDIAAPSYQKYVAVANVFDAQGRVVAGEASKVNAASETLNTRFPGRQQRVAIQNFKSGYTYEVVYSSLDYRGKTSTRVYYLTVK